MKLASKKRALINTLPGTSEIICFDAIQPKAARRVASNNRSSPRSNSFFIYRISLLTLWRNDFAKTGWLIDCPKE